MEYQKIINLLDNIPNQPSKFRSKNSLERNDDLCVARNTNTQVKLKSSMLKSSLCDYSHAYIFIKGTRTVSNMAAIVSVSNNGDEKVILKNCAPFTHCINKIRNTQIDNTKYFGIVISMYNVI